MNCLFYFELRNIFFRDIHVIHLTWAFRLWNLRHFDRGTQNDVTISATHECFLAYFIVIVIVGWLANFNRFLFNTALVVLSKIYASSPIKTNSLQITLFRWYTTKNFDFVINESLTQIKQTETLSLIYIDYTFLRESIFTVSDFWFWCNNWILPATNNIFLLFLLFNIFIIILSEINSPQIYGTAVGFDSIIWALRLGDTPGIQDNWMIISKIYTPSQIKSCSAIISYIFLTWIPRYHHSSYPRQLYHRSHSKPHLVPWLVSG